MPASACIIGAGSSGLTAIKTLVEAGVRAQAFELGSGIGGNWWQENDNGRSAAYDSLTIDTSKERMAFSDFPMPAEYPTYPHHRQVRAYFEAYAEHFDLRRHVAFRTSVEKVAPAGRSWEVTIRGRDGGTPETRRCDAVLVCNGHHWCAHKPALPGAFAGDEIHSHDYRRPQGYAGRRVLVVGVGNSGTDIACEIAPVAARTLLAMRRHPRILPPWLGGRPLDQWTTPLGSRLPLWLQRLGYRALLAALRAPRQQRFGFPAADGRLLSEHPTVSAELLPLVRDGRIEPVPAPVALEGRHVLLEGDRREEIDAIVWATGYRIAFPFLDPGLVPVVENRVRLYRNVVSVEHPGLYFIGLIQPLGAIMPLAEAQARWVADLVTGAGRLPSPAAMNRAIGRAQRALSRRYTRSSRHTIQVDYWPYLAAMERERTRCRQRAARRSTRRSARLSDPPGSGPRRRPAWRSHDPRRAACRRP